MALNLDENPGYYIKEIHVFFFFLEFFKDTFKSSYKIWGQTYSLHLEIHEKMSILYLTKQKKWLSFSVKDLNKQFYKFNF